MGNVLADLLKRRAAEDAADVQREVAGTVRGLEPATGPGCPSDRAGNDGLVLRREQSRPSANYRATVTSMRGRPSTPRSQRVAGQQL